MTYEVNQVRQCFQENFIYIKSPLSKRTICFVQVVQKFHIIHGRQHEFLFTPSSNNNSILLGFLDSDDGIFVNRLKYL